MPQQTLFDTRMDSVTYDMVDAFLTERHRESLRIEYKDPTRGTTPSIPDSTLESITAMSNSLGGIILVGVADEDNHPKAGGWPMLPRSVGRSDQEDVSLSKIADQITPRPQTQVRFLTRPSSPDAGILVIRVE